MMLRVGVSLAAIALAAPALARDKVVRAPVPAADRGNFGRSSQALDCRSLQFPHKRAGFQILVRPPICLWATGCRLGHQS